MAYCAFVKSFIQINITDPSAFALLVNVLLC